MDRYFLKLCWKNIWRNKRRTLLTVNAIGAGVMALVALNNYYDAFHEQVIHNVIRYHSGHLLLSFPGYQTNNLPSRYLRATPKYLKMLQQYPSIQATSQRVLVQGLLSSPQGSANVLITGIDPKAERRVTRFASNMVQGNYLQDPKGKGILVGKRLARLLRVQLGSKVVALTQGVDGSIGNELFFVEGIYKTDSDLDRSVAFVTLAAARRLLSLTPQGAHQIAIVLRSEQDLAKVQLELRDRLPKKEVEVLSWKEIQKPLMAMIELNRSVNRMLMVIILLVAALGIANSILMSILERTREFGVMMAVGTTKKELIRMVVTETFLLSAVGAFLGNTLGIGLTLYFHRVGFDLRWLTSQKIVVQGAIIDTVSYPSVHWNNSFGITVTILFLSMLVSFLPVRHVSKLNAVEALRAN